MFRRRSDTGWYLSFSSGCVDYRDKYESFRVRFIRDIN